MKPATISEVSAALRSADNVFVLPPFPGIPPSRMSWPSNVETFGILHMKLAASLAQEIMIKAVKQAAHHTGVKEDAMIETIKADCEHMLEQCSHVFRWTADKLREG